MKHVSDVTMDRVSFCGLAASFSTAALLVSSPAFAQESSSRMDWQGLYAGVHGGYGWGDTDVDCPTGAALCLPGSFDVEGFMGGIQGGYNWAWGDLLVGVEGDFSYGKIDGDAFFGGKNPESELDWLATLRGRAGFFAMNNVLVYGTGGVAWGEWQNSYTPFLTRNTWTNTYVGWTAGAGIETKITESISVKTEYLHVDFGDKKQDWTDAAPGQVEFGHDLDIVRVGLNFKLSP